MQRRLKARVFQISETRGNTVEKFNRQTTPIGRVVQLRLPFGNIIWHRPVAVEVRQEDTIYRLPIQNMTRRALSVVFLTALATVLVSFVIRKISGRRKTS